MGINIKTIFDLFNCEEDEEKVERRGENYDNNEEYSCKG